MPRSPARGRCISGRWWGAGWKFCVNFLPVFFMSFPQQLYHLMMRGAFVPLWLESDILIYWWNYKWYVFKHVQFANQTCRYNYTNKLFAFLSRWVQLAFGSSLLRSKRWPAMTSGALPFFSWSLVVQVSDLYDQIQVKSEVLGSFWDIVPKICIYIVYNIYTWYTYIYTLYIYVWLFLYVHVGIHLPHLHLTAKVCQGSPGGPLRRKVPTSNVWFIPFLGPP